MNTDALAIEETTADESIESMPTVAEMRAYEAEESLFRNNDPVAAPTQASTPPAARGRTVEQHNHYCMGHSSLWICVNPRCDKVGVRTALCDDCRNQHPEANGNGRVRRAFVIAAPVTPIVDAPHEHGIVGLETLEKKLVKQYVQSAREVQAAQARAAHMAYEQCIYEAMANGWEGFEATQPVAASVRRGRSTSPLTPRAPGVRRDKANAVVVQGYTLTVAVYRKANNPRWCPQVMFTKDGVSSYKKTVGDTTVERDEAVAISEAWIANSVITQEILLPSERRSPGTAAPSLRTMARSLQNGQTMRLQQLVNDAVNF